MVLRSQRPNFPGWHTHLGPKQSRNGISIKKGVVNGKANHFNIFQHPFHTLHFIHLLLPILDSGAFDLPVSHHGGFKIFLSFPTDRRALARNFAHPLDLGTVNSTPKIFSPFLGAPNTAQKVEEMMKLEFSNWFVRTFCAKYNWDSSGTTAIAICKKVCWSNLEYVKTPISKPIWASGMAVAVIAISIPRPLREESNLKRRVPTPEPPEAVSGTIPWRETVNLPANPGSLPQKCTFEAPWNDDCDYCIH